MPELHRYDKALFETRLVTMSYTYMVKVTFLYCPISTLGLFYSLEENSCFVFYTFQHV